MHFIDVYNPSVVQEDIERRRLEKIARKEQESIEAERERVADWFEAYYQNEQMIRGEDQMGGKNTSGEIQAKNDVK